MKTSLTDKQKAFLNALYEEAQGDIRAAMEIAGYAKSTPFSVVVEPLADEILEMGRRYLALNVPKAALAMTGMIDNPNDLGVEKKLTAAKEVMDRAGLVKRDKVEVSSDGISGVFFLPAKRES
jgi:hypothetical protein